MGQPYSAGLGVSAAGHAVEMVTHLGDGGAVRVPQAGADALGHSLALGSAAATPGRHGAGRGRCEGSTHATVLAKVATCEEWHIKRIEHRLFSDSSPPSCGCGPCGCWLLLERPENRLKASACNDQAGAGHVRACFRQLLSDLFLCDRRSDCSTHLAPSRPQPASTDSKHPGSSWLVACCCCCSQAKENW